MLGVLIHVGGDALNNIGVIISAAIIWFVPSNTDGKYYADPAVSMLIALMIFGSSIPLIQSTGKILLQSAPLGVDLDEVRRDLETLPNVAAVHELHVWRLNQTKTIASAHVSTRDDSLANFMVQAKQIGECLHAWGVHSYTLQPELVGHTPLPSPSVGSVVGSLPGVMRSSESSTLQDRDLEAGTVPRLQSSVQRAEDQVATMNSACRI
ncbi:hypothetical protein LTS18_014809, partial [Coniosporium uncinatum]